MSKMIWKFELEAAARQAIEMPRGAEVLCVQMQHALPCLWCLVDPEREKELRAFAVYGTGHEIPEESFENASYIGTVQMHSGALVFHVLGYWLRRRGRAIIRWRYCLGRTL